MSAVQQIAVGAEDADMRLDRWFRRQFPGLSHIRLEKLLRTGQVRVDGKRVKAGDRLQPGQTVRVPPMDEAAAEKPVPAPRPVSVNDAAALRRLVIFQDDVVIALNKPAGLAVQGGRSVAQHIDGMLAALQFDKKEKPRLVHRLDRDTSGVLLLARTAAAARALTRSFEGREAAKLYWAVVVGAPKLRQGRIDLPLAKTADGRGERVAPDADDGKRAVTFYRTVEHAGRQAAWLAMEPQTGRTHQLRVHAVAMGTPILGDGKYGGEGAFVAGAEVARQLHLHARRIRLPHPRSGRIDITAPLPPHMVATWKYFGFDPSHEGADEIWGDGT